MAKTGQLERIHDAGLFAGALPNGASTTGCAPASATTSSSSTTPTVFRRCCRDFDLYLLGEGTHLRIYDKLGAHPMTLEGVDGVAFVVLAPNAKARQRGRRFQFLGRRRHAMRVRGNGFWEIFVPACPRRRQYKFEISAPTGGLPLKSDPVAFAAEMRPSTASIVIDETQDSAAARRRRRASTRATRRSRSTRCISAPGARRRTAIAG